MASARKIAANRRNAAKSTGPRQETAKRRTRRNALRHGLAARIAFDPGRPARVESLAREFVGSASDFTTIELARALARAELDLEQIGRLKAGLVNSAASSMTIAKTPGEAVPAPLTAAIAQVLPELTKIDRYERQAVARRDRALRDLMKMFGHSHSRNLPAAERSQIN
jgi:hypothetical protein